MSSRRDFLKSTSAVAVAAAIARPASAQSAPRLITAEPSAPPSELALTALQAARDAGASYADARVGRYRQQFVGTRERQVTGVSDDESYGIGVRVLVDGAWGFASTSTLTTDGVTAAAREATSTARAGKRVQRRPVVLAPVKAVQGTWRTPVRRDPIDVPIEERVALLFAANETALKVPNVRFVNSSMSLLREEKTLATTDGTLITQTFIRAAPRFSATAIRDGSFESYVPELAPRGSGWEYIEGLDMPTNAEEWANLAVEKLSARSVEVGRYDLILDPTNLWLTIHESVGHPTELDRAMGYEANYAGTSFLSPPSEYLGKFRYGPDFMQFQADRTQPDSLARVGWDDEGVPAEEWMIVDRGIFKDYQTTREQAAWISDQTGVTRSHGCAFAQSWGDVPFQRMPNVSLMPGKDDIDIDDIAAATDKGIIVKNRGSSSIDQQRFNFQFSGQVAYEVRKGKIVGMLKDFAYQSRTPEFWNSMDMIGGERSYWLGGTANDGKGEPGQSNAVSHGCPPARFKNVNIVNTGTAV
ncbi:MAG: TldD/PmbA family protein [Gemmatimonadaceae bacterium]